MEQIIAEENGNANGENYLEAIIRQGARRMLASALEKEVEGFINSHKQHCDEKGHRMVVRNGYHPARTIQTGIGAIAIKQPRIDDRKLKSEERFSSEILPKFMRKSPSLETALPILYLQGISSNKFPAALEAILGKDAKGLSASTIMRLKEAWTNEYEAWAARSLEGKEYVYVWADGIYCKSRLDHEKSCLLVLIGVTPEGRKELLLDVRHRGLKKPPKLAICDGALGFQNAVDQVWGELKIQRCWFHKMGNVLDKLPECVQSKAKRMLQNMYLADTREHALEAYEVFIATFEQKYPKATTCLTKDKEDLFRFYDFPAEHWVHIRTSNPIESMFATVRLRHRSTKGNGTSKATLAMVFKLCQEAEKRWRRLRGFNLLQLVSDNKLFVNGVLVENVA